MAASGRSIGIRCPLDQPVGVTFLVWVHVVCIMRPEIDMGMVVMPFGKMVVRQRANGRCK